MFLLDVGRRPGPGPKGLVPVETVNWEQGVVVKAESSNLSLGRGVVFVGDEVTLGCFVSHIRFICRARGCVVVSELSWDATDSLVSFG